MYLTVLFDSDPILVDDTRRTTVQTWNISEWWSNTYANCAFTKQTTVHFRDAGPVISPQDDARTSLSDLQERGESFQTSCDTTLSEGQSIPKWVVTEKFLVVFPVEVRLTALI